MNSFLSHIGRTRLSAFFGGALLVAAFAFTGLLTPVHSALASNCVYNGSGVDTADFNDPANWNSCADHGIPAAGDGARIPTGMTVHLGSDTTVNNFTIQGNSVLDQGAFYLHIAGNAALEGTSMVTSTAGSFVLTGVASGFNSEPGTHLGTQTGTIDLRPAVMMMPGGTIDIGSGVLMVSSLHNMGTINGNDGVFAITDTYSGGTFNPMLGTVRMLGTADQTVPFTTLHDLRISTTGGTATLSGHTTMTGSLSIDAGSTLNLSGTRLDVTGLMNLSGTLDLAGSSATSTGPVTVMVGGSLTNSTGEANFAFASMFNTIGAGAYFNLPTVNLRLFGSQNQYMDGFVVHNLQLSMSGGYSALLMSSSTVLGTLTLDGSESFTAESYPLTIVGTTNVGPMATVTSTSGIITFGDGVTSTGAIGTLTGGLLFSGDFQNDGVLDLGINGVATTTGNATSTGTFYGRAGSLVIMKHFANDGGVFNAQSGTVKYRGMSMQSTEIPSVIFNNLEIDTFLPTPFVWAPTSTVLGDLTIGITANFIDTGAGNNLTVVGNIIDQGMFGPNASTVTTTGSLIATGSFYGGTSSGLFAVAGDVTPYASFIPQSGNVKFFGNAHQTLTSGTTYFNNLIIEKESSAALTLNSHIVVLGNLTMRGSGGAIDGTSRSITVAGLTTLYPSNVLTTISGNMSFGNTVMIAGGAILSSLSGDMLFSGALSNSGIFSIGSGTATTTLNLSNVGGGTVNGQTGTLVLLGDFLTSSGTFNPGTGTVKYREDTASGYRALPEVVFNNLNIETTGVNGVNFSVGSSTVVGNLTIMADSNMVNAAGATGFVVGGNVMNNGTFNIGSASVTTTGSFTNNGVTYGGMPGTLTFKGSFINSGAFYPQSGTVIYDGIFNDVAPVVYNNLRIRYLSQFNGATASSTVLGDFNIEGSATFSITNSGSSPEDVHLILLGGGTNAGTLTLSVGGLFGPTVTSTGAFVNTGTINANGLLNFGSSFTNSSGAFYAQTSEVRYTGDSASDVGNAVYYLLDFTGSATYSFTASTTAVATTTIASGATLSLGSSNFTAASDIVNNGTVTPGTGHFFHSVDYVRVTNGSGTIVSSLADGGSLYVTVKDQNRNLLGGVVESITVPFAANSGAGSDAETLTLTETSASSGIFRNSSAIPVRQASVGASNSFLDLTGAGLGTATYVDTNSVLDTDSAVVTLSYTPSSGGGGGGGGGSVGGGGSGGAGGPIAPISSLASPVITPTSTTGTIPPPVVITPPVIPPVLSPEPTPTPVTVDFSSRDAWLRSLDLTARSSSDEARILAGVRADAMEFRTALTAEQAQRLQLFVAYGSSPETIRLGEGERRALVRDALETMRTAPTLEDLQRLTMGLNPTTRNLVEERAQLTRVRATFRTIYGHDPVFSNTNENRAWNALMYRVRFPRDLSSERRGITVFRQTFTRAPSTPFQWATVRVLGYIPR